MDAAPAEAEVARRFGATADSLLAELMLAVPKFPAGPPTLAPAARRQLASLQGQVAGWQRATEALPSSC
ncbi:MAG: hypothetical protein WKG07_13915 [Hymenobacter sp.]